MFFKMVTSETNFMCCGDFSCNNGRLRDTEKDFQYDFSINVWYDVVLSKIVLLTLQFSCETEFSSITRRCT